MKITRIVSKKGFLVPMQDGGCEFWIEDLENTREISIFGIKIMTNKHTENNIIEKPNSSKNIGFTQKKEQ